LLLHFTMTDHQKNGKGNTHKKGRKLRLVIDKQLVGKFEIPFAVVLFAIR